MKLIWCCQLAAIVAVSLAAINVEKTVKQVQSILQANQQLPRLTREEILQLLNDIRSEDVKTSSSKEPEEENDAKKVPLQYSTFINELNVPLPNILENIVGNNKDTYESTFDPPITTTVPLSTSQGSVSLHQLYHHTHNKQESLENAVADNKHKSVSTTTPSSAVLAPVEITETTTKSKPSLMVVLPYTPRDGSSLQELYTKPPRVKVVHESSTKSNPIKKNLRNNKDITGLSTEFIDHFPEELKAFLDAHGLKQKPGQDHFLLPLEGFKPMPPVRVLDDTVQLPENLLLTYDLIAPTSDSTTKNDRAYSLSPDNFLFAPLRPELPFELDTSSSEKKEVSIPYDMPVKISKSARSRNYDPIDYDSVKVIPLTKGVNPVSDSFSSSNDQTKRQVSTEESSKQENVELTTSTTTEEPKTNSVSSSISADTDTGASISDLEASFGGAAPSQPGDSELPPPKKNGFYWMLDWNSFLEVGDGDTKINIRFEPKLGDPQMFLPVTVP